MSTKRLNIVTSSGSTTTSPHEAGAHMAVNIFKSVSEQDCVANAAELLLGMVSGGVGILKVTLGQVETRKVLAALAEGVCADEPAKTGVH